MLPSLPCFLAHQGSIGSSLSSAAFLYGDCLQMSLTGVIVGAGKQNVTGPILVVAYWLIGLPLGAVAAFRPPWGGPRLGLLGLWIGMTVAVSIHCISYHVLVFCGGLRCLAGLGVRWDRAVAQAAERLEAEESPPAAAAGTRDATVVSGVEPLPPAPPVDTPVR